MLNKEKPVNVIINKEKCTKCGVCITACDDYLEKNQDGFPKSRAIENSMLGCIQCARCMMKCPNEAIEIIGEDIDKNHLRQIPKNIADYETLNSLLLKRRSIRKFKSEEISNEEIDKILSAAATAPVGIPPSEVKVLVIKGRKKVQEFANDLTSEVKHMLKFMNPLALKLIKQFMSKEQYKVIKDFIIPLCKVIVQENEQGNDILFYDAPAVIVFYASTLNDTAEDPVIAASYATIAAESLGMGTCFIGTVSYFMNSSSKLKKKYGILKGEKTATAFILGKPDEGYLRTFQRNFKEIRIIS